MRQQQHARESHVAQASGTLTAYLLPLLTQSVWQSKDLGVQRLSPNPFTHMGDLELTSSGLSSLLYQREGRMMPNSQDPGQGTAKNSTGPRGAPQTIQVLESLRQDQHQPGLSLPRVGAQHREGAQFESDE